MAFTPYELARGLHIKYRAGQPRDAHGRWRAGDAGAASGAHAVTAPAATYYRDSNAYDYIKDAAPPGKFVDEDNVRRATKAAIVNDVFHGFESPKAVPGMFRKHTANAVDGVVAGWAMSSAKGPTAIAFQRAVDDEFGLRPESRQFVGRDDSDADYIYATHGPFYRKVARAMYDNTQEQLSAAGMDTVTLHRGMSWSGNPPDWVRNTYDADTLKGIVAPKMRPISSWSVDPEVAHSFADEGGYAVVISAKVPRERVFSTARTGVGSLPEYEYVVLDGPGGARVDYISA